MLETERKIEPLLEARYQSSVVQLDEYIKSHERKFGKIKAQRIRTSRQTILYQSLEQLKEALRREKCHRTEAYEHLKSTNKTMKKTIAELRDGFRTCRESIRDEFKKIDGADTDRLLNIDPELLYRNFRVRQK